MTRLLLLGAALAIAWVVVTIRDRARWAAEWLDDEPETADDSYIVGMPTTWSYDPQDITWATWRVTTYPTGTQMTYTDASSTPTRTH